MTAPKTLQTETPMSCRPEVEAVARAINAALARIALPEMSNRVSEYIAQAAITAYLTSQWRPAEDAPENETVNWWIECASGGEGWIKTGARSGSFDPLCIVDDDGFAYWPHENGGIPTHYMPLPPPPVTTPETEEEGIEDRGASADNEMCLLPPQGWWCSRGAGHEGPCAAREIEPPWEGPLTSHEQSMIDAAWERHKAAAPEAGTPNPTPVDTGTDKLRESMMEAGADYLADIASAPPADKLREALEDQDFSRITLRHNIETILREYRDAHPSTLLDKIMSAVPRSTPPSAEAKLRTALEKCRERFAEYAESHQAKANDIALQNKPDAPDALLDRQAKATRNREMVDLINEALGEANPS